VARGRQKGILTAAVTAVALWILAAPGFAPAATITPSITTDEFTGPGTGCSLREAVQSVNDGANQGGCVATIVPEDYGTNDTVTVPAGTYNLTISGTDEDANANGDLDVTEDVTITGTGNPTIDQTVADQRVLDIPGPSGVSLTLNGLTVTGGNLTSSGFHGGNIRFLGDNLDQLTLNDVDVLNGVINNSSAGGAGGGIYSTSPVSVLNGSRINDNEAGGSNGVVLTSGLGGGIFMTNTATSLTVTNSEISSNDAGFDDGVMAQGVGGGIGFFSSGTATITLTNATIDSNRASGGSTTGAGLGGGVDVEAGGTTTLTVSGGSISSNEAGGGIAESLGVAGGLYFNPGLGSSASFDGVDVMGNKAGGNGGDANGFGGGIFANQDLSVDDSTVSGNTAGFNMGGGGAPDLTGDGGGIHMGFGAPADLTVTGSTVSLNRAGENQGSGGGIEMESAGNLSIADTTISGNTAGDTGAESTGLGGGVARVSGDSTPTDSITRTTISGNSAIGIGLNATRGGGLAFVSKGTLAIDASTVSGNTVTYDGDSQAFGGGLSLASVGGPSGGAGTYTITNSTISGNTATSTITHGGHGGGLAIGRVGFEVPAPMITVTHATIAGNTAVAGASGGGSGGNLHSGDSEGMDLVDLRATILADGVGSPGAESCFVINAGMINSQGENVEDTTPTQCELDGIGDQVNVDPMLAALSPANGGDPANGIGTATRALTAGSPAIDSVPTAGCPVTDQRGVLRPQGPVCDAGAYELVPASPPPGGGGGGAAAIAAPPSNVFELGRLRRNKKKGIAFLFVKVPGPGEIGLEGTGLRKVELASAAARKSLAVAGGEVKLKIKPGKGKKARKLLRKLASKGKVAVTVLVTYVPTGGTANTQARKVKLVKL
jgi:hypothetical protein